MEGHEGEKTVQSWHKKKLSGKETQEKKTVSGVRPRPKPFVSREGRTLLEEKGDRGR